MVKARHPPVVAAIVNALDHDHPGFHVQGVRAAREHLLEAHLDAPDWEALADGQRPDRPGAGMVGSARPWVPLTRVSSKRSCARGSWEHSKFFLRSQSGPFGSLLSPVSRLFFMRGLTRSRSAFSCCVACGYNYLRPFVPAGVACHSIPVTITAQRAPWWGCLSRRGFVLESAARVCREAGGRVTTNVRIQDMDLAAPNRLDNRRIEVVVDGLPLFHGAQLAVDTTMVSPLRRDGIPHPRCADISGAAFTAARRRKEATYPEIHGRNGRTRLIVLGAEVGGRWSDEAAAFVRHLANAKARGEPSVLRGRAQQAWTHRWSSFFACSAAKALALSLFERRGEPGRGRRDAVHL